MTILKNEEDQKPIKDLIEECLKEAEEALKHPYVFEKPIKNVAVIGAGPSGLPATRHVKEAGMNVRTFERNSYVGGVWVYSDRSPPKPKIPTSRIKREVDHASLSTPDEGREKKTLEMTPETMNLLLKKCPPSACYRDLLTNTFTETFAYPDFPFPEGTPKLCHHSVVSEYFADYAEHFDLFPLIELNTSVDLVTKDKETGNWVLSLSKYDVNPGGMVKISRWKETFDAVVCATGKHQEPFVPDIKNLTAWNKTYPSKVSHSNQFRRPEDFIDKDVLVVGGSISAVDIVRSIEGFAKSITISIDGPYESPVPIIKTVRKKIPKSVVIKSNIASFSNVNDQVDGTILFEDGTTINNVDNVIFCTGFMARFNYLGDNVKEIETKLGQDQLALHSSFIDVPKGHVVINRDAALNLYREVFLLSDPTLAFVGIPPYPSLPSQFDVHARAASRVWSGHAVLPNEELMYKFAAEFDPDISLLNLFNAERRNRVPFVAWLNHHAKAIDGEKGTLPKLDYLGEKHEELGKLALETWGDITDENYQKVKKHIRENYL